MVDGEIIMFKKGQVWRAKASGNIYRVTRVLDKYLCEAIGVAGSNIGQVGGLGDLAAKTRYELIGNNYQERPTRKALPGQRGRRKEDC
jgi:hypothetical protein